MAEITAALVRELREKTGAGMMECKKALSASNGDLEAALDELRKSGLKTAAKKAGRATSEGRVYAKVSPDGKSGALVSISCETDFVAATNEFQSFLDDLASHVLEHKPADLDACLSQPWKGDGTVADALKALVGRLGENIQISGAVFYTNPAGGVGSYVHHDNKKGAMVSITCAKPNADTFKELCMHAVVFNPPYQSRDQVTAEAVEREKEIIRAGLEGKPADIQEKIMVGRLEKFYAETVITEQPWIKDDKLTVQKALDAALGGKAKLEGFTRFEIGA
ncbi:MAG: translation elongation factor Ts [Planctomycetes bacterium]|nr:translation elongation factor Ts [Planctomycetota bacterium]MCB9909461.1 translation elongation factor Ts [Planctomycetota bacterium]HPF13852.1 translation elongation factor Ts [Planctomycetota bacterium]HRV81863.1 translation elongation factor Ts [Planctomycetota bacterium]